MSTHFHPLTIKDIRKETSECISISFDIPEELADTFRFIPGQNLTLRRVIDGEELRRSYSICSLTNDEVRVAVKLVPKGRFSTFLNTSVKAGDTLEVLPPAGRFYTPLDETQQKNYIAFAAGSGITPIIAIISATLALEKSSRFTLVYGNRNRNSIIFKEQLESLKNRYPDRLALHHVLSREVLESPVNNGRIDAAKCREMNGRLFDITQFDTFFLCGPEEMIFSVRDWLTEAGIDPLKIHFELFAAPGQAAGPRQTETDSFTTHPGMRAAVTLKADGIQHAFELDFDGISILDAALKQGVDLPFACKGGVCATCKARLLEGEVKMDTNYALEPDELQAGFILTCQSHPRSQTIVVDFDH